MKKLIVLLFCSVALFSCKKTTYLSSSNPNIELGADESNGNINISSDGSDFELTHSPSWMEVTLKDSTISYKAPKNVETFKRNDSIVVKSGDISLCIPVTQFPRCTQLSATEARISFSKEGGKKEIAITTDGRPTATVDGSNIKAEYGNGVLTVTAEPNTTDKAISGTLTLTADDQVLTIKYTINGNICATCKGTGRVKCPDCRSGMVAYGNYDLDACTRCGGISFHNESGRIGRYGTGRIKCPDCGGTGK